VRYWPAVWPASPTFTLTTIALAANSAAKCALAFGIGGRRFGIRFSALLAVPVAVTAITLLVRLP
jgi:hypothetical protein